MLFLFCKWTMPLEQSFLLLFSSSARIPFILEFALVCLSQILHWIQLQPVSLYLWSDLQSSWSSYAYCSWHLHSCGYIVVMEKRWKCILGDWEYRKHPHLLSSKKIDPGDGTSVPIPVFMPSQTFRAPSQSMRPLFLSESFDRASGDQPPHAGSWRSFMLSNRYSGGSIYPSLPPIPTSSNAFIDEGDTVMANLSRNYISGLPLPPPGLMSTPPRVLLRPSVWA